MVRKIFLLFIITAAVAAGYKFYLSNSVDISFVNSPETQLTEVQPVKQEPAPENNPGSKPTPQETTPLPLPPATKILQTNYHVYQTFNNCGPASLSMALRFYGIDESQQKLGYDLRPYQVANGNNDDKAVTMEELAEKSREYGFIPYFRPNGTTDIIKLFIANDIPVITKTWLKANEDIGHFRVVKGYNEKTQKLIQDDSYQGPNKWYKYSDFNEIWKKFNYEFLVLVPKEKDTIARQILGDNVDAELAWTQAAKNARNELYKNPNDVSTHFNLVVALYNTGKFQEAVDEFEKIEDKLPKRTLWYQIEPIKAYFELGEFDRVMVITEKILNSGNRAFSELYLLRGNVYFERQEIENARSEFEQAVYYNVNLQEAKSALAELD